MVVLTNLPPPTEGVRFTQPQVSVTLHNRNLGNGTLYIAESCVSWVGDNSEGFSLQYPSISLHAVSRDLSTFPQECIYVMVEAPPSEIAGGVEGAVAENGEADEAEFDSPVTEVRFIPVDKSVLDQMFTVLSECQALHPDENDSFSEEEGEEDGGGDVGMGQFFTAPEDVEQLSPDGQAVLARLSAAGDGAAEAMETGDDQFQDANSS